jgi:23S rRNA (uracil1939-C5)-methyltransferase
MTETLTIARLGAGGDGVADTAGGPVFVPFTLPGEVVAVARVKNQATVMSMSTASPERVEPPCVHFGPDGRNGTCGGCTLQHASDPLYHAFKRSLVVAALKSKGLDPEVQPLVIARPGERRRVVFTARKTEKGVLLGFNQAGTHHIVSIDHCPISSDGIVSQLEPIRLVAGAIATSSEPFRVTVLETLSGLDLAFEGVRKVGDRERHAVTKCVLSLRGITRVSSDGEILIEPLRPASSPG